MNLTKFKSKPLLVLAALIIIAITAVIATPIPQTTQSQTVGQVGEPPVGNGVSATPASPASSVTSYTIIDGDTLEAIASRFNIDVDTILGANPNVDENNLHPGDQLTILSQKGVVHTADMGDTLWSIANEYGVDVAAILKANTKESEDLTIGEKLFIPGAKLQHKEETVVARAEYSVSRSSPTRFYWPAHGELSSHFGYRWGRLHAGIDIANDIGTPVTAAMAGRVVSTGWQSGYGYTLVIEHARGYETLYGHLSEFAVTPGQYVRAGQTVAYMGNTGYSTGPHVHFEVHKDGRVIDPLGVLP